MNTLITGAQLYGMEDAADLRIAGDRITAIARTLEPAAGERVVGAGGGLLLPGLHDHHMHLLALGAALESLQCGPPAVHTEEALAALLRDANSQRQQDWLRGVGYHACVAGDIDRDWLDRHIPDRPVRIQHRGGRAWIMNSRALQALELDRGPLPAGLELEQGRPTGRLLEEDVWLRTRLKRDLPDIARASRLLAGFGVTGITDTTPGNGREAWDIVQRHQSDGRLLQTVRMMGGAGLDSCLDEERLQRGEFKIHLLESQLPEFTTLCRDIAAAHAAGRAVAVHCVTLTELVFALSALESTGVMVGDRIEHASVCPPQQLRLIAGLGLRVVVQPHFIAERGDQYARDVDPIDQPWLYRAAAFLDSGVALAAGSDAPFGAPDPWRSMQAAVTRSTAGGRVMGQAEALTPEQALGLYLSPPGQPGTVTLRPREGQYADLCLLHEPWEVVRGVLDATQVRCTWCAGQLAHGSV